MSRHVHDGQILTPAVTALPGMPAGSHGIGGLPEVSLGVLAIHDGVAPGIGSY